MITSTYYVQGRVSDDGLYAVCSYFYDKEATRQVQGSTLSIPLGADACTIQQADRSDLVLLAASFKTLGHAPVMKESNFSPADIEGAVEVSMPATTVVTKGVVLLFSNPGAVEGLYASADPQVVNGDGGS